MSVIAEKLPTYDEFTAQLNSRFRLHIDSDNSVDAFLVESNSVVTNEVQQGFSLMFRAPSEAPPVQNTYRLEHERLGAMDLFLVPVRKDDDGLYYEAIFSHLLKK